MTWHYRVTDGYGWTTPYSQNQEDNAQEIWNILLNAGWTENSIAAVLGNFQSESFLNPGQWEIGYNYSMSRGTGLGQWTPATKVSNFCGSTDLNDMANGSMQMQLFLSTPSQYSTYFLNPDGSSHYYNETGLPYLSSMSAFSQSNASVEELTKVWCICWERCGKSAYHNSIQGRIDHATHWYTTFHGSPPTPPTPPPDPPDPPTPPTPPTPITPSDIEILMTLFLIKRRKKKY